MNRLVGVVEPVAKKRDDQTVKIERMIATKLRVIVESLNLDKPPSEQTSLAEYLSDIVRDKVQREYQKALKTLGEAGELPND